MNNLEVLNITRRQFVFSARMLQHSGGGIRFFVFADEANFSFGFSVFPLKNCGLSVLASCAVRGLSPVWFSVFVNDDGGFSDF